MKVKHLIFGLLAIVFIVLAGAVLFMENIVKGVVSKYGSEIIGTEVALQGFSLNPFKGTASINGFTVANPKNYQSPYLFNLGGVSVKINTKSIFSNTIIIDDITVSKPIITYEMISLNQNNIKQIQENITQNQATAAPKEKKEIDTDKKSSAPAKKVIIRKITIAEGEVQALTSLQNNDSKISVKLPAIVLTDIGADKNEKGVSIASSISRVISKILNVASKTVIENNLGDLKKVAKENLNNAVDSVKDKVKNLGIFGKK